MVREQLTGGSLMLWFLSTSLLFVFWAAPLLLAMLPLPYVLEEFVRQFPINTEANEVFFLVPSFGALLMLSGNRLGKYLLGPWLIYFIFLTFGMFVHGCGELLVARRIQDAIDVASLTLGIIVFMGACLHLAALLPRPHLVLVALPKRIFGFCVSLAIGIWGTMFALSIVAFFPGATLVELTGAEPPHLLICFFACCACLGVSRGGENQRYFLGFFLYTTIDMLSDCLFAQEVDYRWWTPCIILYTTCIVSTLVLIAARPAAASDSPKQIRIPAEATP